MSEEIQTNSTEFLLKEYDQSWDYIKFHYEQRDKCERFFFSMMLAAIGLVLAIWEKNDRILPANEYLLLLILPLLLLGLFTLGQITAIRRTTTRFHKQIVVIRRQLKGPYASALWLYDDPKGASDAGKDPRDCPRNFHLWGFNSFSAFIIMVANAILAYFFLAYFLYSGSWPFVRCSTIIIVLSVLFQFLIYWLPLKRADDKYITPLGDKAAAP